MLNRRGVLAAATALTLSVAGCTKSSSTDEEYPNPSGTPNYDRTISIRNQSRETQTVDVTITHMESEDIVATRTHPVAADERVEAFKFTELRDQYSGVVTFEITAEIEADSNSAHYKTNDCYQSPSITITDEERLGIEYAIC